MAEEEKDEKSTETNTPSAEDIAKMQAALKKANDEAAKFRHEIKAKDDELSKLKAASDSSKSEMDKVTEQIAQLEKRAADAERKALVAEVAQDKKLPAAIANRLTGSTKEELEADADELIEALGLGKNDPKPDDDEPKPGPFARPKEKLRPGASNDGDEAPDYEKIAEKIASKNKI
jgi:chromosome segregation ATPase